MIDEVLVKESNTTRCDRIRKLVGAKELLKLLWTADCRPSLRWLREQQAKRQVPYIKVGHRVWFDPDAVAAKWARTNTVKAR